MMPKGTIKEMKHQLPKVMSFKSNFRFHNRYNIWFVNYFLKLCFTSLKYSHYH